MADVRSGTGYPTLLEFTSPEGTPLYVDLASGEAFVMLTDGTIVPIGGLMSETLLNVQSTGKWRGNPAQVRHIMGNRTQGWSSVSLLGDVCNYLDTSQQSMNTPTTGQTLYLVSTSASDAAAGTGARTVKTWYLDASGVEQTRTDTLNGTTPVSLGSGYSAIQVMEAVTVGSGGVAAGNVSITSTNGAATVATTFEQIQTNGNHSLSARWKVPAGCTAFLYDWFAGAVGNTMDSRVRADSDFDANLTAGAYHFKDTAFLAAGGVADQELHWQKLPAGATVKVSAIPGLAAAGNKLGVNLALICVAAVL
jgi:hypothetical protein